MGRSRKDRLSFRRLEKLALLAALAGGAALTPGTISGDAGRTLTTFLGLISASILPTISLLVNSMTASGRSVQSINRLENELEAAMDALFLLFGCVGVAVAALVALTIQPATFLVEIPYLTTEFLPRCGQAFVVGATTLMLLRIGQIPGILRRSLQIRRDIAVEEARNKLEKNAPESGSMRKSYASHDEFGKVVSLQDLQGQETR